MIEARHLTKPYGNAVAVDDVSFGVQPGRVTGFLGPNGAGKSTHHAHDPEPGHSELRLSPCHRPAAAAQHLPGALHLPAGRRGPDHVDLDSHPTGRRQARGSRASDQH